MCVSVSALVERTMMMMVVNWCWLGKDTRCKSIHFKLVRERASVCILLSCKPS